MFQNSEGDWSLLLLTCLWITGGLKWPIAVSAAAWTVPLLSILTVSITKMIHLESSNCGATWLDSRGLDIEDGPEPPSGVESPQPRHGHGARACHQVSPAPDQESRDPIYRIMSIGRFHFPLFLPQNRLELADDLMSKASSDEGLMILKQRRMTSYFVFAKLWLKKSPELISFGRKSLLFILVWEIMLLLQIRAMESRFKN